MSLGLTIVTIGTIHFSNGSKNTNMPRKGRTLFKNKGTRKGL